MTTTQRPNVLWVSFEDTYPFYGCYGDSVARTPTLDKLATEGCVWTNAFSTAGVCAPARAAVITGMYPTSVGTHHMRTVHKNTATPELPTPYEAVVPHYVKCFPEYMRQQGYYCTNNAKTDYQFEAPFTAWDECSENAHWRNRPDLQQPFFAVFNPCATHESSMWPQRTPEYTFDPEQIQVPPYFPDTPEVRKSMARMYTRIEENDRFFGQLLQQLEEDGLADNTIVMHWSDHGPLPRGKRWPYDSGIRVPMIVRWPGQIDPGTVSEQLVSTVDLAPTVFSACNLPIPTHLQGQAFLGNQAEPPRDLIFASRDRYDESYDMVRAARDKRYKYIRNYHPELPYLLWIPYRNKHPILTEMWRCFREGNLTAAQEVMFQCPRPVEELYDTTKDPHEVNNLADDPAYKPELARLRSAMDQWRQEVGDLGEENEAEMVRRWYPNGEQPATAAPIFIPLTEAMPGREAVQNKITLESPALIQLHSATQGASIGYTFTETDDKTWQLYTQPLQLTPGHYVLRTKAIRIGYKESTESKLEITVK